MTWICVKKERVSVPNVKLRYDDRKASNVTHLLLPIGRLDVRVQILVLERDHEAVVGLYRKCETRSGVRVFLFFLQQRDNGNLAPRESLADLL